MIYAGLRRKDALTRKYKHLFDNTIYVEAIKGSASRTVPVIAELQHVFSNYLKPGKPEEYLLQSPVKPKEPIADRQITKQFAFFRDRAGLPRDRTLHGLRHSFITEMLKRGLNTSEVKVLAGHSTVAVTEMYTHFVSEHLRDKMNKK
jgi:integrase